MPRRQGQCANVLDRHRRTHEARADGEMGSYSDDDLEIEENEFGAIEEESPQSHSTYLQDPMSSGLPSSLSNGMSTGGMSSGAMSNMVSNSMRLPGGMSAPNQLMSSQQLIQQPI